MNRIFTLFIALTGISSAFAQDFSLLDNSHNQVMVSHHLEAVPFKFAQIQRDGSTLNYIDFSQSYKVTMLEKGAPQLPTFSSSVILPAKGNAEIAVEYDSYYEIDGHVAPSKGNLKRNVDPASVAYTFGEAYNQNAFFPGNLAVASEPFILRELRGQTITFYPYQYNPVTGKIRIYENLRVRVITNTNKTGINEIVKKQKQTSTDGMFNQHFINGQSAKYAPKNEEGEMLVICPDEMVETILPLVQWKNQKGIKTTVVTTSATGTTNAAIKAYIQSAYETNGNLLYLLLVGDHENIPAYTYGNSGGEELFSDSYYGQLSSDYYPELFVGRFSGNATTIKTMVDRGLEYEKNPAAGNWMTKAIGLGSGEGSGYGDDGEADWQHLRNIRTQLMNFGYTKVHEFYDGSRGGEDASGAPNSSMILPAINEGIGLFNYTGHGDLNICVTGNFTSTNINAATNNGKYPMVLSVACNNGTYTYGTCISEVWLRASKNGTPSGAIAACGSSILMAWAQPMQTQDEMAAILTESYATNRKTTLGGLFYNAQMSMLEKYPGSDGNEVMQTWVFFGDPSVEFRNKETADLTAAHASKVPMGTSSLAVSCNTEGALVSISQNDVFLGRGTVSGGKVTVNFPAITSDEPLLVTATKQNYRPYQGNVAIGDVASSAGILIYPNPAQDQLTVEFTSESQSKITLVDVTGKVVRKLSAVDGGAVKSVINTAGLSAGVYQVVIESGNQKTVHKVVLN